MRTDGKFTTLQRRVRVREGEPLYLIPFGDVHHDSDAFAEDVWADFMDYLQRERSGHRALLLGMGDYNDFLRCHDRVVATDIRKAGAEKVADLLEQYAEREQYKMRSDVWPYRKQILGLLSGNHYFEYREGITHSDERLACELGCPYLGVCSAITLNLVGPHGHAAVRIIAHHGVGAATTLGGGLNRVQRFLGSWEADIAVMGDNHQRGVIPTGDRLSFGKGPLSSRTQWVGRTGGFLRGYIPDHCTYITDAALAPSSLGWIEFELRLQKNKAGSYAVKIRGIQ
jgi:hypothetical protein